MQYMIISVTILCCLAFAAGRPGRLSHHHKRHSRHAPSHKRTGKLSDVEEDLNDRIVGGKPASKGSHPYIVSLMGINAVGPTQGSVPGTTAPTTKPTAQPTQPTHPTTQRPHTTQRPTHHTIRPTWYNPNWHWSNWNPWSWWIDWNPYGYHQYNKRAGNGHFCGGSLIHRKWVLTAAHCVKQNGKIQELTVRIGEYDRENHNEVNEVHFQTKRVIPHDDYNDNSMVNDIALIELDGEVDLVADNIETVPLAKDVRSLNKHSCTVAGWGTESSGAGSLPTILREVDVKLMTRSECQKYGYQSSDIKENMICASSPKKDSCQGDSGGPLVCDDTSGKKVLAGIVSWGQGCAEQNYPGVYTSVASYTRWICDTTKKDGAGCP